MPEHSALRAELAKLSHPARPDVNWQYIETLCLNLFERNGVEMQTAAWYTEARTRLAGVHGLNEGLAIITALMTYQWGALWPQATHARMDILCGLSHRLQQLLRTLTLDYADLNALYQVEKHLSELGELLQRLELKYVSQIDALRNQLHAAAVRLENSNATTGNNDMTTSGIGLPTTVSIQANPRTTWVYVAQEEPVVRVETITVPVQTKPWKPFIAGITTMLVVGSISLYSWNYLHRSDPVQVQLRASVAPLPMVLSAEQIQSLQRQTPEWLKEDAYPLEVQQRLTQLAALPPGWALEYGNQLVGQVQALWPQTPLGGQMATRWQQHLKDTAMSPENLKGWHQGMGQLQQLIDRLNGLDEKRGKYMTVSELKTVVFGIQQSFNKTVPAEEQLRRLDNSPSPAQAYQAEAHLKQLISRYALLKQGDPDYNPDLNTEESLESNGKSG
jgi:type VI secretion system protein VasL